MIQVIILTISNDMANANYASCRKYGGAIVHHGAVYAMPKHSRQQLVRFIFTQVP